MDYDTIPFVNIDTEIFIGRFDNEDYEVKPGEKRFFPDFLSQHFAKQLLEKMWAKIRTIDKSLNWKEFEEITIKEILGKKIMTAHPERLKTIKEKVLEHEKEIKEMLIEEEKKEIAQKIEAQRIINKENV